MPTYNELMGLALRGEGDGGPGLVGANLPVLYPGGAYPAPVVGYAGYPAPVPMVGYNGYPAAMVGWDVGADPDPVIGYDAPEVAYDGLVGADDQVVGWDVSGGRPVPVVRRAVRRSGRRAYPPAGAAGRPGPGPMAPPARPPMPPTLPRPDVYDNLYRGAMQEAGANVPTMAIAGTSGTYNNGDTFAFTQPCPKASVLMTISVDAVSRAAIRNCQLLIGGVPAAGLVNFQLTRFAPDSNNARLPAVEIGAGAPITFTGTVAGLSAATFLALEIQASPQNAGVTMASLGR